MEFMNDEEIKEKCMYNIFTDNGEPIDGITMKPIMKKDIINNEGRCYHYETLKNIIRFARPNIPLDPFTRKPLSKEIINILSNILNK